MTTVASPARAVDAGTGLAGAAVLGAAGVGAVHLTVENVSKRFGGVAAVTDVSLTVPRGGVCLLYTSPSPRDRS